jgi:hypothetical protein
MDAERARNIARRAEVEKRAREASAALEAELARAIAAAPPPSAPAPNPARKVAGNGPFPANQVSQWLAAANDPKVMQGLAAQARSLTLERYAKFYDQLHLAPAESESLTKLFIDKRQTAMDLAVAMLQSGVDPRNDLGAFQAQVAAGKTGIEGEIHDLLGDDRYAQYQAYNRDVETANTFIRLDRTIGNTENALTPDQTAKLRQLLNDGGSGQASPAVMAAAQSFLTPTQLQALQGTATAQAAVIQGRIEEALPPAP